MAGFKESEALEIVWYLDGIVERLFWNFVLRQKPWGRPVFTDWPSSKDRKSIFYLPSQRSTTLHDYQFCNWVLTQTLQNSRKYESHLNSSKNQCYSFSCKSPPLIYCIKCRVNGTGGAIAFLIAPSTFWYAAYYWRSSTSSTFYSFSLKSEMD